MGDVVRPRCVSYLPIPPASILDEAPRDLTEVIVVGIGKDGDFYFASSEADGGNVLWWLEMAKRKLAGCGLGYGADLRPR